MSKSRFKMADEREWLVSFYQELHELEQDHGVGTNVLITPHASGPKLSTSLVSFRLLADGEAWLIASVSSDWPNSTEQSFATHLFNLACKLSHMTDEAMARQPHLL